MSTELIPAAQFDEIMVIDQTAKEAQRQIIQADQDGNQTVKALLLARATRKLQSLLNDTMMEDIMALQSTTLGFRTDKDRVQSGQPGYPVHVVRDVVIQALLRGFQVTGNQINIIGGNLYVTKEGFEHRLANFDGLTDLQMDFEVPDYSKAGTALVGCVCRWMYYGQPGQMDCTKGSRGDLRIPIRVNNGMGDDAILGKGKSKLLRKVFERVSGMSVSAIDDAGTVDAETVTTVISSVVETEPTETATPRQAVPLVAPANDVAPEPLPEPIAADLYMALDAIADAKQLRGCWEHWDQKAKNRNFSKGQIVTIRNAFSERKKFLETV